MIQPIEIDIRERAIAWANNSLFGSLGFFLSTRGGEPDEHHLDTAIENLKTLTRERYARIMQLEAALREIALRTSPYQGDENWPLVAGVHRIVSEVLA